VPIYRFVIMGEEDADPSTRWTHLPNNDAAQHFAQLLIRDFKEDGRNRSPYSRLVIQDDSGATITSIAFRDID
jgi:hypothetical protein